MSMISELVEKLRRYARFSKTNTPSWSEAMTQAADTIEELSEKCRTIDVEPVRHGHMIWKKQIRGRYRYMDVKCSNAACGMTTQVEIEHPIDTKTAYCSECGKRLDDNFMNYCPNCGAKMNGESEVQE